MPTLAPLPLFCAAVPGLLLSPGPNMALVISHGLATWPASFDLLRHAGAARLVGPAVAALRRGDAPRVERPAAQSLPRMFRSAVLVSLLNPKTPLFFLVFLPQFADPRRGRITGQLALFGLLLSAIAPVFHALLGLGSGHVAAALRRRGAASRRWLDRLQAGVLAGLALRLLALEVPEHP